MVKLCVDAQLCSPPFVSRSLDVYLFLALWMLNLIDPAEQGLPLAASPPPCFAALPEYHLFELADFVLFAIRYCPEVFKPTEGTGSQVNLFPVVQLFVHLICSPTYVTNPYLRSKFVDVIHGIIESQERAISSYIEQLDDPVISFNLIPGLIRLYVGIEHTGRKLDNGFFYFYL